MLRTYWLAVFGMLGLALTPVASAEGFAIDLEVKSPRTSKTIHAEMIKLGGKPKQREILEFSTHDKIIVRWKLQNAAAKGIFKDVLVHFFVVKEDTVGQQARPKLDKSVKAESALTMDFRPGDKTETEMNLQITRPGVYLLCLETIGATAGQESHDAFSALDLVAR